MKLRVIPKFFNNPSGIISMVESQLEKFKKYPTSTTLAKRKREPAIFCLSKHVGYEFDQCQILSWFDMNKELRSCIVDSFMSSGHNISSHQCQIQRYTHGDYLLPHCDYIPQSIVMLTDSETDSLIAQDEQGKIIRIKDSSGTLILIDPCAFHWVDPVLDSVRYTMTISPPIRLF